MIGVQSLHNRQVPARNDAATTASHAGPLFADCRRVLASLRTAAIFGIDVSLVHVEVDVSQGLPTFTMVGLPDASVRESRDRVRSAIRNAGFPFPAQRVTVNLAPGDIRKAGASFDLPIALGVLAALGVLDRREVTDVLILGALSLDGSVRAVPGVLAIAAAAAGLGIGSIVVPTHNASEASVLPGLGVLPAASLREAVDILNHPERAHLPPPSAPSPNHPVDLELADIRGQRLAKRGLELAAAGGHHLLLIGPPGAGKTMLARRLPGLLPPASQEESLEITALHSVAGLLSPGTGLIRARPFRAPHHTISQAGLVGGGSVPRPGEATLAHRGVLFLDEILEFRREALDALRQPIEEGRLTVARASRVAVFPARFLLVGAANPCPCGFAASPDRVCRCTPQQVAQYQARLSGPIRDRFDLSVDVQAVPHDVLVTDAREPEAETSAQVRERVETARATQAARYRALPITLNSELTAGTLNAAAPLDRHGAQFLHAAARRLGLSARAFDGVRRVARTVADLQGSDSVADNHLAEALHFRTSAADPFSRDLRTEPF